jgi:hypothetical protein
VSAGDYDRIRGGNYVRRGEEPPPSAEFDAAAQHYRERFSQWLERAAGGAQRLVGQLEDWLSGRGRERSGEQDDPDEWDE